jgi:serine/threonine-protein kinase HipA
MPNTAYVHAWENGHTRLVGQVEQIGEDWPPAGRSARFRYARAWVSEGFAVDPINLPLIQGWQTIPEGLEVPGALRDAGPDGWGKLVIDRERPGDRRGQIEYLLDARGERAGCLDFSIPPDAPALTPNPDYGSHGLEKLLTAAICIENGEPLPDGLADFFNRGSSPGGARPKATFQDDHGGLWIAKFPMQDDLFDNGLVEAACLDLAELAGIETPEHRIEKVGSANILLVRRFDRIRRDGIMHRLGYLSANTVLGADPLTYKTDLCYADLMQGGSRMGVDPSIREEMFRRMILNVAVGNTDDHLLNHAFIRTIAGKWRLSPVFDVVPQPQHRKMVLRLSKGHEPDLQDAVASHEAMGISTDKARMIADQVVQVVSGWRTVMEARNVKPSDLERITPAFSAIA